MPYTQTITREYKGLFVFLLDQSYSMQEPIGNSSECKMAALAKAINALLNNLLIRAADPKEKEGTKDYLDIAIVGYRTDKDANPIIESPVSDALRTKQNQNMVMTIVDVKKHAEEESGTMQVPDSETGETQEMPVQIPTWVRPKAEHGTPMCYALRRAIEIVDAWIAETPPDKAPHVNCYPPIVINITDGETTDGGDPLEYAKSLQERKTNDGNVLLFNIHLSSTAADPFLFPFSSEILPDGFARLLFNMSSLLPETMVNFANSPEVGYDLKPGARGMVFNADMVSLIHFLDMGTKPALR